MVWNGTLSPIVNLSSTSPLDSTRPIDDAAPGARSSADSTVADLERPRRIIPRLEDSFLAVLQERAIYYPVCYTFERELGRGRQGRVFVGLRQGARGCVTRHAIKLFDPSVYPNIKRYWTDMGRIASQVSALQTLRSPCLVSTDTYDEVNGIGYVQMEIINGADLREVMRGDYLPGIRQFSTDFDWAIINDAIFRRTKTRLMLQPGVAVYILRMMLKGLESLHQAGFVHCDIKPSNVMVDRFGYVKLVDFGRALKPNERASVLFGSPLYMAPEIHRRMPATEQSDLYSVGLVALELLSGKPLVEGTSIREEDLLAQKLDLPRTLPSRLPEHVRENADLVKALHKFLEPDPAKRFPDARSAETEQEGLRIVHKQLVKTGMDADYSRMMGTYMSRFVLARAAELDSSPTA